MLVQVNFGYERFGCYLGYEQGVTKSVNKCRFNNIMCVGYWRMQMTGRLDAF